MLLAIFWPSAKHQESFYNGRIQRIINILPHVHPALARLKTCEKTRRWGFRLCKNFFGGDMEIATIIICGLCMRFPVLLRLPKRLSLVPSAPSRPPGDSSDLPGTRRPAKDIPNRRAAEERNPYPTVLQSRSYQAVRRKQAGLSGRRKIARVGEKKKPCLCSSVANLSGPPGSCCPKLLFFIGTEKLGSRHVAIDRTAG